MKLLIDDCFGPEVARRLRDERDQDAVSALEHAGLRGKADRDLFEAAQSDGRALVTENIRDYRPLAERLISAGESHAGLVFTTDRRWPRNDAGALINALERLLVERPDQPVAIEIWL